MRSGLVLKNVPFSLINILSLDVHFGAKAGDHVWFYAIEGDLGLSTANENLTLSSGQAIALQNRSTQADHQIQLSNGSASNTRFAIFMGTPIKENFVQRGPFAMSSEAEIDQITADYKAGKLGELAPL